MNFQEAAALIAILSGIGVFWWWLTQLAIASALRAKTVQDEFEKRELKTKLDFMRIEKYISVKLSGYSERLSRAERAIDDLHNYTED